MRWRGMLDKSSSGAWMKSLTTNVAALVGRKHGELKFCSTQLISGHECFNSYLHRIGKAPSLGCSYCNSEEDTAEQTLFGCSARENKRAELVSALGEDTTVQNLVKMLGVG